LLEQLTQSESKIFKHKQVVVLFSPKRFGWGFERHSHHRSRKA
jgi:hypothetical protein